MLTKFERTVVAWRDRLGAIPEEVFAKQPADNGWSAGQICHHLSMASERLLAGARACTQSDGEQRGFSFLPALITSMGTFPPAKIKVPDNLPEDWKPLASPEPTAKSTALEMLAVMEREMRELREPVDTASPKLRREHPAGGWMHARQWYQIAEMHLRHHLRQLGRLEKELRA